MDESSFEAQCGSARSRVDACSAPNPVDGGAHPLDRVWHRAADAEPEGAPYKAHVDAHPTGLGSEDLRGCAVPKSTPTPATRQPRSRPTRAAAVAQQVAARTRITLCAYWGSSIADRRGRETLPLTLEQPMEAFYSDAHWRLMPDVNVPQDRRLTQLVAVEVPPSQRQARHMLRSAAASLRFTDATGLVPEHDSARVAWMRSTGEPCWLRQWQVWYDRLTRRTVVSNADLVPLTIEHREQQRVWSLHHGYDLLTVPYAVLDASGAGPNTAPSTRPPAGTAMDAAWFQLILRPDAQASLRYTAALQALRELGPPAGWEGESVYY